jgi:hypothetical protein
MSALWKAIGVVIGAFLVAGVAVYQLRDRSVLVPPPEAVAEEFGTKLTLGRYAPARSHLAESLMGRVTTDSLRAIAEGLLARSGDIIKIESAPGLATDDTARPLVTLVGERHDTLTLDVPLVWEQGTWKVADVP